MIGSPLVRRVAREYRRVLVALAVALAANVIAYLFLVYPLSQEVANIEQREESAARELAAARQAHADAVGTLTGMQRAETELARFYADVLPTDLSAARRLTSVRLPQLADSLDIAFDSRRTLPPDEDTDSALVALRATVDLAGRYADIRTFIHQLESSPEFIVIDNITLAEGAGETGLLELTLDLSTYYQAPAP